MGFLIQALVTLNLCHQVRFSIIFGPIFRSQYLSNEYNHSSLAFKSGTFAHPDSSVDDFGNGEYGNLHAMVAAVILDPEARSVVIDADPTSGSLTEPMVKLTRFMRAMEFQKRDEAGDRLKLVDLQEKIGQEPHRCVCRGHLKTSVRIYLTSILCVLVH